MICRYFEIASVSAFYIPTSFMRYATYSTKLLTTVLKPNRC